jgi:hypothetical protein
MRKKKKNKDKAKAIKASGLIDLDECVLGALNLFRKEKLPSLRWGNYRRPLVVGSGNAAIVGKILFEDKDAVFADESTYQQKLKAIKEIDEAVLISASGGKHAPLIAKELNKRKIRTRLMTCNPEAPAKEFVDRLFVFPKQPEPYTYNTSTYMGMILAKSRENPQKILDFIKKRIRPKIPQDLKRHNAFFIIVPPEFELIREMFLTKFDELFGPKIKGRAFTSEQAKHAKTVVPSDKELFIGLGYENRIFGRHRLNLPLPEKAGPAAMMALGYYLIGQIQKQHPPYFKKNIGAYVRKISSVFGQEISIMVE